MHSAHGNSLTREKKKKKKWKSHKSEFQWHAFIYCVSVTAVSEGSFPNYNLTCKENTIVFTIHSALLIDTCLVRQECGWKDNCFDRRVKTLKCGWHPPYLGELALLLMYKRLYTFLNKNNVICNLKFGFRQQYSISCLSQKCQLLKIKCGWNVNSAMQPDNYSKFPKWSPGVKTLKAFGIKVFLFSNL